MTPSSADLEAVRSWLRRQGSELNPGNLTERIRKGAGLPSRLIAYQCLRELARLGEVNCAVWGPHEPLARVQVAVPPAVLAPEQTAWRAAIMRHPGVDPTDHEAFYRLWPKLTDWPESLYTALIDELLGIRERAPEETIYLTSAAGRLASSKLLSTLPRQALKELHIPVDGLTAAPPCFLIAGAAVPSAVVLVENPNAFERAVAVTADMPVCWISTYGFGAAALEGGERLAEGLERSGDLPSAIRSGTPPPLMQLLSEPRIFYWGDLDVSGLQIFLRVRSRLPCLRLSALYRPMATLLAAGGGHPYVVATGKADQNTRLASPPPEMGILFRLCSTLAVDQEYLSASMIRDYALHPFD